MKMQFGEGVRQGLIGPISAPYPPVRKKDTLLLPKLCPNLRHKNMRAPRLALGTRPARRFPAGSRRQLIASHVRGGCVFYTAAPS